MLLNLSEDGDSACPSSTSVEREAVPRPDEDSLPSPESLVMIAYHAACDRVRDEHEEYEMTKSDVKRAAVKMKRVPPQRMRLPASVNGSLVLLAS